MTVTFRVGQTVVSRPDHKSQGQTTSLDLCFIIFYDPNTDHRLPTIVTVKVQHANSYKEISFQSSLDYLCQCGISYPSRYHPCYNCDQLLCAEMERFGTNGESILYIQCYNGLLCFGLSDWPNVRCNISNPQ